MNHAELFYNENKLNIQKAFYELNIILNKLLETSERAHYFLGSKRSYYEFKDNSRIVWNAVSNLFVTQ